jgi:hypothetical protein
MILKTCQSDALDRLEEFFKLGELWEKRSKGKCLFIMPKGQDFDVIRKK